MDRKVFWVVEDRLQDPVSSEKRGCDGLVIGLNGGDWPFYTHLEQSNLVNYESDESKVNHLNVCLCCVELLFTHLLDDIE